MRRLLAGVLVAGAVAVGAGPAGATFDGGVTAAQTVSTIVLADPSTVDAGETACAPQDGPEITVTWAVSGTGHDGLTVTRSDDGGATFAAVGTLPAGATTSVDTGVTWATTYVYAVVTTRAGWTSPGAVTAAVTTSSKGCRPPR